MRIRKENWVLMQVNYTFYDLPCPINLTQMWGFGSMLGLFYVSQLVSGFLLSIHYVAMGSYAFDSVMFIERDVINGWAIRSIHSNGASFMMGLIYLHIGRGLFFSSYTRLSGVWFSGLTLLLMTMASAFFGYVLPWGQMSYWGATVISNMFSVIPFYGTEIVQLLWGGYSVGDPTLNRFYSIHFILPWAMIPVLLVHLVLLHEEGSSNPLGADDSFSVIPFYPYFFYSDLIVVWVWLIIFSFFVFVVPHYLGCPENFELANPMKTPIHIQPEWYFLPFYAILRTIPHKAGGVVTMLFSFIVLYVLPYSHWSWLQGLGNYKFREILFWGWLINWLCLGWLGACPMAYPYLSLGLFHTFCYFFYFLLDYCALNLLDPSEYKYMWSDYSFFGVNYYNDMHFFIYGETKAHVSVF